jgi:hypothetical protein
MVWVNAQVSSDQILVPFLFAKRSKITASGSALLGFVLLGPHQWKSPGVARPTSPIRVDLRNPIIRGSAFLQFAEDVSFATLDRAKISHLNLRLIPFVVCRLGTRFPEVVT